MASGPIELLLFQFPGYHFNSDMMSSLADLVHQETIRIIDIIFFKKDWFETLSILEFNQLEPSEFEIFKPIVGEVSGFLSDDDVQEFAATIAPDSVACLILFQHTWAVHLRNNIEQHQDQVILNSRISPPVIERMLEREISILRGLGDQYSQGLSSDPHLAA